MTRTITLLGDSVFDNATYAAPGPSLSQQVAKALPEWRVDMRAVDGATAKEIEENQLARAPNAGGALVLSAGGNDALNSIHLLGGDHVLRSNELWEAAYAVRHIFRRHYSKLLEKVCAYKQPVAVCTIYNPTYDREPEGATFQRFAECGLALFNDIIVHEALRRRLHIIDLRDICTSVEDFANPIEPSARGGQKITEQICYWAARA